MAIVFILLQHASGDEFVNELLHGVEGSEEALWRHDEAGMGFWDGGFASLLRLEAYEIEANHIASEMNLAEAVREDFFFVCHDEVS